MITLVRYDKNIDGDLLCKIYRDPQYVEFFRRCPPSWTDGDIYNFETLTQSQLFKVMNDEWFAGFVVVAQIDSFALTCQIGMLLIPEYRDQLMGKFKVAFWGIYKLCEMLFERTTMRKASMKFLKSREDIDKSLSKVFTKEGDFKESSFCYGKFQDEVEYAITKEGFNKVKESLCQW